MAVLRMASEVSVTSRRSMGSDAKVRDIRCREPVDKPLRLQLLLNRLVGAGFLAEPGLEEIFGESAKGFRVTLSIDVALEAFNLKGLRHGELNRGHRLDAMGHPEVMALPPTKRCPGYTIPSASATGDDDCL